MIGHFCQQKNARSLIQIQHPTKICCFIRVRVSKTVLLITAISVVTKMNERFGNKWPARARNQPPPGDWARTSQTETHVPTTAVSHIPSTTFINFILYRLNKHNLIDFNNSFYLDVVIFLYIFFIFLIHILLITLASCFPLLLPCPSTI